MGNEIEAVSLFQVFDRWGALIYEQQNFQANDETFGWNGNYNGEPMNNGVYVYFAEVQFTNGTTGILKGEVLLLR